MVFNRISYEFDLLLFVTVCLSVDFEIRSASGTRGFGLGGVAVGGTLIQIRGPGRAGDAGGYGIL
mgnify:CR=1 FL=1